jgi:protein O-mannosyl-transferase
MSKPKKKPTRQGKHKPPKHAAATASGRGREGTAFAGRPSGSSPGGLSKMRLLLLAGVLLATFLAYLPVLDADFINYDDDVYITENPYIRNFNADNLKQLFSSYYYNQYSPVAMTLMALQMIAFGVDPTALKLISVLLHVANTLLVFLLIRQLFNRFDYAIITAALFGLHTLQVESVAWLTASMKIGAYSLFFLAALLAYVYYLKKKNFGFFILSLALFLLSCFSKEQAIALSVTLLAVDYLKGRNLLDRRVILEKIPFFIISLIFGVVTLSVKEDMQSEQMTVYFTFFERLIFASFSIASYLLKLILPTDLSAFYTYPLKDNIPFYYYLTPVVALGALFALYYSWKKGNRTVTFGILFFFINIFLTILSQVMSVRDVMMADRYLYLPAIGFFLIVAYSLGILVKRNPGLEKIAWGGLAAYGLLLASMTYQRVRVWENSITIFTDVIEKGQMEEGKYNPFLSMAYNNRGIARKNAGDIQGALADYNLAIASSASDAKSYLNRANINFNAGQYEAAIVDYNKSIELDPSNAKAYSSRGAAYAGLNNFDLALNDLNRAIEISPDFTDAIRNRALIHYNVRRFDQALADLDRYLRLKPTDADVVNLRALTLTEMNRTQEAEAEFTRAIQMSPNNGTFYLNRSMFYNGTGRRTEALQDARQAIALGTAVNQQYLNSLGE